MKITFKREERSRGLAVIGEGARGWEIKVDGEREGSIRYSPRTRPVNWGWRAATSDPLTVCISARSGRPHINTDVEFLNGERLLFETLNEAKAWAKSWIREHAAKAALEANNG